MYDVKQLQLQQYIYILLGISVRMLELKIFLESFVTARICLWEPLSDSCNRTARNNNTVSNTKALIIMRPSSKLSVRHETVLPETDIV